LFSGSSQKSINLDYNLFQSRQKSINSDDIAKKSNTVTIHINYDRFQDRIGFKCAA